MEAPRACYMRMSKASLAVSIETILTYIHKTNCITTHRVSTARVRE